MTDHIKYFFSSADAPAQYRIFLTAGMGAREGNPPASQKWGSPPHSPPPGKIPPSRCIKSPNKIFIFSFSCSHCSIIIFVLISYSLYTQVVPILILIDVQYLQKAVFCFEKGLNGQNHSSSGSHLLIKKSTPAKFLIPPPLKTIWKTLQYFPWSSWVYIFSVIDINALLAVLYPDFISYR